MTVEFLVHGSLLDDSPTTVKCEPVLSESPSMIRLSVLIPYDSDSQFRFGLVRSSLDFLPYQG